CPAAQVVPTVVSTTPLAMALPPRNGDWHDARYVDRGAMLATIGAAGCGQRATYQVLCAPHQGYQAAYTEPGEAARQACDVVPSTSVGRVMERNSNEQHVLDEQAAAQQAAEAQQQQQQRQQQQQQ